ncbi:MAG TPA: AAA family ATPase [Clostridia bacterium]|nr:AAA family ATPase [Clostridia bacterium]
MLYFKIICKTLKNYDFEDNKELKSFMNVAAARAEAFSGAYNGSANFHLTQVKKDKFIVLACAQAIFFADHGLIDESVLFFEQLELAAEPVSAEEIAQRPFMESLRFAERMGFLGDGAEIYEVYEDERRMLGSDSSYREKIIEESFSKTQAIKLTQSLLCTQSMVPELKRIFAGKGPTRFTAHPVHYMITSNDETIKTKMTEILAGSLLDAGRLLSRRVGYYSVSGDNRRDIVSMRKKYALAEGGVIILDFDIDEADSEFADFSTEKIRFACEIIKEYRKTVLSILCFNRGSDKLKRRIYDHLVKVAFVELSEETVFADKAKIYLKNLAKEKGVKNTASLVKALPKAEKGYLAADLNKIFDKWYDRYLRTDLYPQYAVIESVEKTIVVPKGSAYKDLQEMVGLTAAKEVLEQALDYYKAQKLFKEKGMPGKKPSMHMIFTGNPGTAKTSVARLIAQVMKDNDLLAVGDLIEVGRADLVGKFVGWTAQIVQEKFAMAAGSVLFIDEAYALVDEKNGMYGDEAINTIVQEMENARDDTIVIFAGYPDKMEGFLEKNPGLRSRIAFHVHFPDYTQDELMGIMHLMVKNQKLTLESKAEAVIQAILAQASQTQDYGNGRFVRNTLEKARMKQASRLVAMDPDTVTPDDVRTLTAADFEIPEHLKTAKVGIGF